MNGPTAGPAISESFLEHRQTFAEPWIQEWSASPSPFVVRLLRLLRGDGAELADFSSNPNVSNLAELALTVTLRKWNAGVRIGLDSVTYMAANPRWEESTQWVALFERISNEIQLITGVSPASQQSTFWLHVTPAAGDFGRRSAEFVNREVVGEGQFYGLVRHEAERMLLIDKSVKYERAAFVRIQRTQPGQAALPEAIAKVLGDEVEALRLLGVFELP